jgi:Tfp pilus assembly protein PilX
MRNALTTERNCGSGARSSERFARGSALVIAMMLLFILSLLAVTSMSMSTAEVVMAGNEQFRRLASDAASAGVETAVSHLRAAPVAGEVTSDVFIATVRHVGDESSLPQSSAGKFVGQHFEIESTGQSARGASDVQTQGVMVILPAGGVTTYGQIGDGLQGGESP